MLFFNIVVVLSLASTSVYCAASEQQLSHKGRRGGTVGLFNFPRVGRAQASRTWQLSPQDISDLHTEMKRQGLIPFPRTGRSMSPLATGLLGHKRAGGDNSGGMWFGPRLGKRDRTLYDDDVPWTMIALREVTSPRDFTPRLGRESEELLNMEEPNEQNPELMEPIEQDPQRIKREAV